MEKLSAGVRVMSGFRNIESLLLSDGVLCALCKEHGKSDRFNAIRESREKATSGASDDFKPAAQAVHHSARTELGLSPGGETSRAFLRDFLAPLMRQGMPEYEQLKTVCFDLCPVQVYSIPCTDANFRSTGLMHDTSEEVLGNARTENVDESPVHVGLDVHKDSIAVAVARHVDGELRVEDLGEVRNAPAAVRKLVDRLSADVRGSLRFVYEAGPCGYALLRRLRGWDLTCDLIAPSQIPRKAGDRVKTDRRDARELARLSMMGYLQPLWVPDPGQEALRDLVRLRMSLKESIRRARQRIGHFLLRQDRRWGKPNWTAPHRAWMKDLKFEQSAHRACLSSSLAVLEDLERRLHEVELDLQRELADWQLKPVVDSLRALRGVDELTAVGLLAELGDLRRFPDAGRFMSYLGLTPSEWSSGGRRRTGALTKTGNGAARRLLTESAWTYRHPARETRHLQRKAANASDYAKERAWAAQKRLCRRYQEFLKRGTNVKTAVSAIARELAGFVWDIACHEMPNSE